MISPRASCNSFIALSLYGAVTSIFISIACYSLCASIVRFFLDRWFSDLMTLWKCDELRQDSADQVEYGQRPDYTFIANKPDEKSHDRRPDEHRKSSTKIKNGHRRSFVLLHE